MFRDFIQDMKELYIWCDNWLYYRRHALKLRLAVNLADMKQRAYNKRYFVVTAVTGYDKNGREKEKLVSINKDDFKMLKRRKWLPKDMDYLKLSETCFYQTELRKNNSLNAEERRKAKDKYMKYALNTKKKRRE